MLAGESLYSSEDDTRYLSKLQWLWENLSEDQKKRIISAVSSGTLLQQQSRNCIIGNATENYNSIYHRSSIHKFIDSIFYDGPSYDKLFSRKITPSEKKVLDDIYYGRIRYDHNYTRANELVYKFVTAKFGRNY